MEWGGTILQYHWAHKKGAHPVNVKTDRLMSLQATDAKTDSAHGQRGERLAHSPSNLQGNQPETP